MPLAPLCLPSAGREAEWQCRSAAAPQEGLHPGVVFMTRTGVRMQSRVAPVAGFLVEGAVVPEGRKGRVGSWSLATSDKPRMGALRL